MLQCKDIYACNREIAVYTAREAGVALLVGIEKYADYISILSREKCDTNCKIVAVSGACNSEIPPNPQMQLSLLNTDADEGKYLLIIGITQVAMIRGRECLEDLLKSLASLPVSRPVVVLCPFCVNEIDALANKSQKLGHWAITLRGNKDSKIDDKPIIRVYPNIDRCYAKKPILGMKALLKTLEETEKIPHEIPFVSSLDITLFKNSLFQFSLAEKPYNSLCKTDSDIAMHLSNDIGADKDWEWLDEKVIQYGSFVNVVEAELCSIKELPYKFTDYIGEDDRKAWLTFAALKTYCQKGNDYLTAVLAKSKTHDDFIRQLYFAILDENYSDTHFANHMKERGRILDALDDDSSLMQDFCSQAAALYEGNSIYYFRDSTEDERNAIIEALCSYTYPTSQLQTILDSVAPELAKYLRLYRFDQTNTKVMSGCEAIRPMLTEYFRQYKLQKLTNRIDAEFLKTVEEQAVNHDFLKLRPRSTVVKSLNKSNAQPYWIDALSVEYMGYIAAKCSEYGMICECEVAYCNMPSITCNNKEFIEAFTDTEVLKEERIDELKHHSQKYNYTSVKTPLHIFDELSILNQTLKNISSLLSHDKLEKAIILSDHGASRLAVTYESENEKLELEKNSIHSGRCCPVDSDPNIPFCIYESGFAILANYERFKGGRKASVEVHGGASLEEVLVPVLTLTAKPKKQRIFFPEDEVKMRVKEIVSIRLFADPQLNEPKLIVNGILYTGEFCDDPRNVRFNMPEIKRKGHYNAEVYDGSKKLCELKFSVIKPTTINELL